MRRAVAGVAVAAFLTAAPALADQQITAGPGQRYLTTHVTMAQGERLTFQNNDVTGHDVTARANGSDGKPLFATPRVESGGSAPVEGSQYLTSGSYDFYCSIHPDMEGTLTVTTDGTPAQRPSGGGGGGGGGGGAGDTTAPGVTLSISNNLRPVAKSGKLKVRVTPDENASVEVTGTLRAHGKKYTLTAAKGELQGGREQSLELGLPKKAKRALKHAKSAKVSLSASARDAAGNHGSSTLERKLSR